MFLKIRLLVATLLVAMLICGTRFSLLGHDEWKQSILFEAEPERVACAVFEARGPVDNHHIELRAFNVSPDLYFAYQAATQQVLIPAFPLNRRSTPRNEELRVLLQFDNVQSEEDLVRLVKKNTVSGVVAFNSSSVQQSFLNQLEQCYPGIDLAKCYVIHVGRRVPNAKRGKAMLGMGVATVVVAMGLLIWNFKRKKSKGGRMSANSPDPATNHATEFSAFDHNDGCKEDAADAVVQPEPVNNDEDLAIQREFAERYGIGGATVLDTSNGQSKTPGTLSY